MRLWAAPVYLAAILILCPGSFAAGADPASGRQDQISVAGVSGEVVAIGSDVLGRLPTKQLSLSFLSAQGNRSAAFAGPLLWDVLMQTKAIDPAQHQSEVSQYVVLTGRDG
ncbi:MAG: hypothetical protein JO001_05570 [Alphaproteobacteria bacterium]|nr:hypothetical protein [Alphaproteobacteria bacterium]